MSLHSRTRRNLLVAGGGFLSLIVSGQAQAAPPLSIAVHRDPGCGCCHKWAMGLQADGFIVTVIDDPDRAAKRLSAGIPAELGGCHTAFVGDYVIEGHVPSEDIVRLLKEKPKALGLAVPGMPMGSPGMETTGPADSYDVMLVLAGGAAQVYASH